MTELIYCQTCKQSFDHKIKITKYDGKMVYYSLTCSNCSGTKNEQLTPQIWEKIFKKEPIKPEC